MELSKQERKKLIAKINRASGIAQYALEAKMTDEQVIEATNNLMINNYGLNNWHNLAKYLQNNLKDGS